MKHHDIAAANAMKLMVQIDEIATENTLDELLLLIAQRKMRVLIDESRIGTPVPLWYEKLSAPFKRAVDDAIDAPAAKRAAKAIEDYWGEKLLDFAVEYEKLHEAKGVVTYGDLCAALKLYQGELRTAIECYGEANWRMEWREMDDGSYAVVDSSIVEYRAEGFDDD